MSRENKQGSFQANILQRANPEFVTVNTTLSLQPMLSPYHPHEPHESISMHGGKTSRFMHGINQRIYVKLTCRTTFKKDKK